MKKQLILLLTLFMLKGFSQSQIELGARIGGSNYLGDSSPLVPVILETNLSYGAFANIHFTPKMALKINLNKYTLSGSDANLTAPGTVARGIAFSTDLLDAGLALQYYPKRFERCEKSWAPYIFGGLSYMSYQTSSSNSGLATDAISGGNIDGSSIAIPVGIGIKKVFYKGFALGAEIQCSKTFTDELDFSTELGNSFYKDWYLFGGVTFSYVFGKCADDYKVSRNKAVPCPVLKKGIL